MFKWFSCKNQVGSWYFYRNKIKRKKTLTITLSTLKIYQISHSFGKHLLSTYHVIGFVLSAGHIIVNKTDKVVSSLRPSRRISDSQSMYEFDPCEPGWEGWVVDGISARCVCVIHCLLRKHSVFNSVPSKLLLQTSCVIRNQPWSRRA